MSLLAELNVLLEGLGMRIETGIFKGKPPEEYAVITPLADTFEGFADDAPQYDVQEVRISLFSKANYMARKNEMVRALRAAGLSITDRRYIGFEEDTDYHHYAIDVAKHYGWEE